MTAKVRSNFAASKLNKKLFKLMLNANSISVAQSVKFNEIFTDSAKTINDTVIGQIFCEENFAKGWDNIYVQPSSLPTGSVDKGMRCITTPTILITTKNARMAFVLASEEEPVYFRPEGTRFSDGAYLLSYNILPVINPERSEERRVGKEC